MSETCAGDIFDFPNYIRSVIYKTHFSGVYNLTSRTEFKRGTQTNNNGLPVSAAGSTLKLPAPSLDTPGTGEKATHSVDVVGENRWSGM